MQALLRDIWKHTVEKSQRNATNTTTYVRCDAILGDIWKNTAKPINKDKDYATMPS